MEISFLSLSALIVGSPSVAGAGSTSPNRGTARLGSSLASEEPPRVVGPSGARKKSRLRSAGAAQSSAEWVVERPKICYVIFGCSLTTLANFGSVTFTDASATDNGTTGPISAASYMGIEMVNDSTPIAVPGSLDPTGTSFTDTYQ